MRLPIEQVLHRQEPGAAPGRRQGGFTLTEVLVAVALFSVVVLAVLAPLTGLFGLSQQSGNQATATAAAQGATELIRGQWQSQAKYDEACFTGTALPAGVTSIKYQNEDAAGAAVGSEGDVSFGSGCGAAPGTAVQPLRRLTVKATKGTQSATLSLEVARP